MDTLGKEQLVKKEASTRYLMTEVSMATQYAHTVSITCLSECFGMCSDVTGGSSPIRASVPKG